MILKEIKFFFFTLYFFALSNCIGIVCGDFSVEKISTNPLDIEFESIEYMNCEPLDHSLNLPFEGIKVNPDNKLGYKLQVHHTIPKEYTNDLAVLVTIMSLGVFPFFHSLEGQIDYIILKENQVILQEKDTLKIYIFYGWLFTFTLDYFKSPNLVSINEGTGLNGAMVSTLYHRFGYRIQKKILEKK